MYQNKMFLTFSRGYKHKEKCVRQERLMEAVKRIDVQKQGNAN